MERGGFRYDQYTVLLRLLTYDLRSVSGTRSVAVGSSGKASAVAALAKQNAKSRCAGFDDFGIDHNVRECRVGTRSWRVFWELCGIWSVGCRDRYHRNLV